MSDRFKEIPIERPAWFLAKKLNEIVKPGWAVVSIQETSSYIYVIVDTQPPK